MRLGPLRFLACVAVGTMAWAVSRVPVVVARAEADVAAAAAWQSGHAIGERLTVARLDPPMRDAPAIAAPGLPNAPVVIPHSGEGRNPVAPQVRILALVTQPGSGLRRNDGRRVKAEIIAAPAESGSASEPSSPSQAALFAPTRSPPSPAAFDLAAAAYADLTRRDRRSAAARFDAALAADPGAPNAAAWRAELRRLRARWSGDAYVLVRGAGPTSLGVAPLLGGGQSGGSLAFTPDPLARRPLAVVARATVAHEGRDFGIAGIDRGSLQTALGVRWQVAPGASLTAERLIAAGSAARDAWVLRAAGGAAHKLGPVQLDAYAEAGVVGARRRDTFASAQARAALPLPTGFDTGGGAWASVQDAASTVHRVDIGPTIGWRAGPLTARADWRFRVAGNAAPGSGPALTLSAAF